MYFVLDRVEIRSGERERDVDILSRISGGRSGRRNTSERTTCTYVRTYVHAYRVNSCGVYSTPFSSFTGDRSREAGERERDCRPERLSRARPSDVFVGSGIPREKKTRSRVTTGRRPANGTDNLADIDVYIRGWCILFPGIQVALVILIIIITVI